MTTQPEREVETGKMKSKKKGGAGAAKYASDIFWLPP